MRDDILDDEIIIPKDNSLESAREIIQLRTAYSELHKKVSSAKTALLWLIGLQVLGTLVEAFQYDFDPLILSINAVLLAIFIGAAMLASIKPKIGFIIALTLMALVQILAMMGDPIASLKGVLIRAIIAYYIVLGLNALKQYKTTLKGLKAHGIKIEGTKLI